MSWAESHPGKLAACIIIPVTVLGLVLFPFCLAFPRARREIRRRLDDYDYCERVDALNWARSAINHSRRAERAAMMQDIELQYIELEDIELKDFDELEDILLQDSDFSQFPDMELRNMLSRPDYFVHGEAVYAQIRAPVLRVVNAGPEDEIDTVSP